jgi:uncharacterized protein (TIGR00304 family)
MRWYSLLSIILFIIGIFFFLVGFLYREVEVGIFLIFPFIIGTGIYVLVGFFLIFFAVFVSMLGFGGHIRDTNESGIDKNQYSISKKTSVKGGGIILIGPIPIVFGSNWKITVLLMILAIIIIFLSITFIRII